MYCFLTCHCCTLMNVWKIIKNLHPSLSLSSEGFDYLNWMRTGSCINLIFLDMDFGHWMQSRFEDFCWLLIFWLDHVIVSRSHSTRDSSLDSTAVQHSTAVSSTVQWSAVPNPVCEQHATAVRLSRDVTVSQRAEIQTDRTVTNNCLHFSENQK